MSLFHLGNAVRLKLQHFPLRFPAITHQTGCFISPVYFSSQTFQHWSKRFEVGSQGWRSSGRLFSRQLVSSISQCQGFFPNPYNNKMATTDAFITSVNNYFDSQKPEFAMQCPFFSTGWTSTIGATITKLMLNSLAWYFIMNYTTRPNTPEICLNRWPPWKGSTIEESNWHHEWGDGFGQILIQAVGGTVYQNNHFQQRAPPQIGLRTQTIWIKDSFQTNWNCQSLIPLQGMAWRSQHAQQTL